MSEPPKLLDRVRTAIRVRHYSVRTEKAYVQWIRRFILYHGKRHPSAMGANEINAFKDVDFARGQLTVRDPKWKHDRPTMLPATVTAELHEQIVHARLVHQEDLACGWGETWLPDAIARKLPNAARDPRWHWVFPATRRWRAEDGKEGRHHLHETVVQRAVSEAARTSAMDKRVTCHTFRHHAASRFMPSPHRGVSRERLTRRGFASGLAFAGSA